MKMIEMVPPNHAGEDGNSVRVQAHMRAYYESIGWREAAAEKTDQSEPTGAVAAPRGRRLPTRKPTTQTPNQTED